MQCKQKSLCLVMLTIVSCQSKQTFPCPRANIADFSNSFPYESLAFIVVMVNTNNDQCKHSILKLYRKINGLFCTVDDLQISSFNLIESFQQGAICHT
jgi:hypothetical protein